MPTYQREIDLLDSFIADLRKFHRLAAKTVIPSAALLPRAMEAASRQQRIELHDWLNRRVPAVRLEVQRTGVSHNATDERLGSFDLLDRLLDEHLFEKVLTVLQQAVGVFERDILPEDEARRAKERVRREAEEDERREREKRAAEQEELRRNRKVPLEPIPYDPPPLYVPVPGAGAFMEAGSELAPAPEPPQTADPEPPKRLSLKERIESHAVLYVIRVAIAAFALGVGVGLFVRDGIDAAVRRLGGGPAQTSSPAKGSAAPGRP